MSDKTKDELKNKKDKNKVYRNIGIIVGIIFIIGCIALNSFTKKSLYNGKIANNIFIEGIEVSDMKKEQAIEAINKKYRPQDLSLDYHKENFNISSEDIDLKYNTEELVNKAYNSTRTGSYFKDITSYIEIKLNSKILF